MDVKQEGSPLFNSQGGMEFATQISPLLNCYRYSSQPSLSHMCLVYKLTLTLLSKMVFNDYIKNPKEFSILVDLKLERFSEKSHNFPIYYSVLFVLDSIL